MDSKIVVYGICMAMIIAALAFWFHMLSVDEINSELLLARQETATMSNDFELLSRQLAVRKEVAALLGAVTVMETNNRQLEAEIEQIRKSKVGAVAAYRDAISRVREQWVGKELPSLSLRSGVSLHQVKVQSLGEKEVVLKHDGGIVKVAMDDLPESITNMLLFKFNVESVFDGSDKAGSKFRADRTMASDRLASEGKRMAPDSPISRSNSFIRPSSPNGLPGGATRESLGRLYIPGRGWVERRTVETEQR